jgi:hypothetical protein
MNNNSKEAGAVSIVAGENWELRNTVRELQEKLAEANLQKESLKKILQDKYRTTRRVCGYWGYELGFCDGLDFALQELDKWKA